MSDAHQKRNFWCHSIEGGLYMGGMAFLSAESVLPTMVHSLGGSEWLVAFTPSLLPIGFFVPVLFVVPLLNRLHRYKPTVIIGGLAQRIPYLVAALALYFFADDHPDWMLAIVVGGTLLSGVVGGFTINAWLEMVTRMVPERRRASGWAIRFIIQGLIGIAAGPLIHLILETSPGPPGYALLYLIAFAFVMASLITIGPMVESDLPTPRPHPRPGYLREILDIPRRALRVPAFRLYLWVRFSGVGYFVLAPFMAIHALAITNRPEEDVGYFVTSQMLGWICGNFLAARLGDRRGGKAVIQFARLLLVAVAAFVAFNESYSGFVIAFFAFGFAFAMERVGDLTLGVELCPREDRQAFLALLTFILLPGMLLAAALAGAIETWSGNFAFAALATILVTFVSLPLLHCVPEPRKQFAEVVVE